jgi:hypothetical protein
VALAMTTALLITWGWIALFGIGFAIAWSRK